MKAQIQMMETISVIFIFFVLILVGFFFYSTIMSGQVQEKQDEARDRQSVSVAQLASHMPELQCAEKNIIKENCVDWLKAQAAPSVLNTERYFDLFGFSKVTIQRIFPASDSVDVYDRPLPDFSEIRKTLFPISVYDATEQINHFGVIVIEVYS